MRLESIKFRGLSALLGSALFGLVLLAPAHAGIIVAPSPRAISASQHTCVLISNGTVYCWGRNDAGQVGLPASQQGVAQVTQALGLGGAVKAISAGGMHTCALLTTGAVQCWGFNFYGQVGTTLNIGTANPNSIPTTVAGLKGPAIAISAGDDHTCALVQTASGNVVQCWGNNFSWQLGNSAVSLSAAPMFVPTTIGATAITAGWGYTCALMPAPIGSIALPSPIRCWGTNSAGQLGRGFTSNAELPGSALQTAFVIRAGSISDSMCGRVADGTLRCWGDSNTGELGNGTIGFSAAPVAVQGSYVVSAFDGGVNDRCAISSGAVLCWGDNAVGQLGTGATGSAALTPVASLIQSGATAIAVGGDHACAIVSGHIKCWGENFFGELGNGGFISTPTPTGTTAF